jgi:dTDP-4-dehydrorhamnose reductase
MRLLLFGGWGQLGVDFAAVADGRHDLVRPRHSEVDICDGGAVDRVVREHRPDVVLNAAAFHKVEACEEQPQRALAVNTVGALQVARAAGASRARCVFVSTDYVFDGEHPAGYREDHPPAPLNVYGVSKAAGERMVRIACQDSLVVRGSGLFGHAGSSGKGGNFIETMLSKARAGERISVVDDQAFAPTSTRDMAERILQLLEFGARPGIYHLANAGSCSWYGFATKIFELAGIAAHIAPRSTGEPPVRRPRWSVLLDTRSVEVGLPPARPWEDALRWYLDTRPARQAATAGGERRQ